MSFVDVALDLLFIVFVVLMSMVGILFIGAVVAGLFFLLIAAVGWIMTLIQSRAEGSE
jgi:hypothetical protein